MPINRRDAKPMKAVPGIWVVKNSDPNGPDRYIVRICYRDPKTGRKIDREGVVRGTLEDALAHRDKLQRGAKRKESSRERWRDFVDRWASDHLKTVEPSTRARYINAIAHLNRGFGDFFVDALEAKDLKGWFHSQEGEYSAVTINGWITVMRLALDEAVSAGTLATNPARKTKALTTGATKGRRSVALSPKQFRDFIAAIDALRAEEIITLDAAAMILTLAWTGARMGEARALRWEDWYDGELHIERAI
jgi:integrase